MSNDNKTLADAQPGGRVRLGDQAERARFEAFLSENPLMALCAGTAWQVWQAALSAQPSPGGQDALAVIEELAELNRACAALDPDYKGPSDAAVQAAIAALSAQPSPEGQGDADGRIDIGSDVVIDGRKAKVIGLDPYTSCLEIEWANAAGGKEYRPREQMSLASRQPVEVSEGEFRAAASRQTASAESNATAEAMIAIARQPVGEPVAVVGADFDLFWIGSGPIAPLVERNGLRPGSKLYAAPPAQAVDLGQLQRYSKSYSEGIYLDGAGDWVRFADVLALIDSQAVQS